jgi:hypothetical protein
MRDYSEHWTDISDFVIHLTRGGPSRDDLRSMFGIYADRVLRPGETFGIGRKRCPDPDSQLAVCFSEIPPGEWARLEERRGTKYGIAFRKRLLISRGAGPIWYVWKGSPQWLALHRLMEAASTDVDADIWKLTPLIDAPGEYGHSRRYFFEWEREWRHVGQFAFEPKDVAFLLIPEDRHADAREFFEFVHRDNTGPAYLCPYIDPSWDRDTVMSALRPTQGEA